MYMLAELWKIRTVNMYAQFSESEICMSSASIAPNEKNILNIIYW